jgi:hypothetical protein
LFEDQLMPSALLLDNCRRRFVGCPQQLREAGRAEDAALFDLDTPNVTLANTCDFRCTATPWLQGAITAGCAHPTAGAVQRHHVDTLAAARYSDDKEPL